jgi:cell division protein FtsI (penicillin-binding protein 3)
MGVTGLGHPERRQRLVLIMLVAVLVGFAGRIVHIQAFEGPALAAEGQDNRMTTRVEPAQRGKIISADGTVLAADVVRYEVQANPRIINATSDSGRYRGLGPAELARQLAPLLKTDQAELETKLSDKTKEWVVLIKHATQEQWDPVKALVDQYWDKRVDIGVYSIKHYVRSYPAGTVAGNLIGYQYELDTHEGEKFYTGMEDVLTDRLAGKAGKTVTETGGYGQPIPGGRVNSDPAEPGCDVTLTIDSALQFEAQEAIQEAVDKWDARAGMVVAIDTTTGEILALADSDTPDPSNPTGQTVDYTNSRAVENVFEPGSTGKVVTMSMLIEEGYATPASQYSVPAVWTVGGQTFQDSHGHGQESWTLAGILAMSSNVGTVMAGQPVPDQVRYDYLKKFGFGEKTGVELRLEAEGMVHKPGVYPTDGGAYWDGRTRNAVLFGQGVSVTALQATEVFATLGNGGLRATPHLVKGATCPGGNFTPSDLPEPTRVVSEETAGQLVTMMEQVVGSGTGKTAAVDGYRTAGKTGTSQMWEDDQWKHVGSFVGLVPAESPRVAIGAFLIDPKGGIYGSEVAAPVFERVATVAVDRLGVAPSVTPAPVMPLTW